MLNSLDLVFLAMQPKITVRNAYFRVPKTEEKRAFCSGNATSVPRYNQFKLTLLPSNTTTDFIDEDGDVFSHDSSSMLIGDLFEDDSQIRHAPQLQAAATSPLAPSSSISPTLSSDLSIDLHQVPILPFDGFVSSMALNPLTASPATTMTAFVSDAPSVQPAAAVVMLNSHQSTTNTSSINSKLINLKTDLPPLNLSLDHSTVVQAWREMSGQDCPVGCPTSAAEAVVPTFNFPTVQQLHQSLLPETIQNALCIEQQQHSMGGGITISQYQYTKPRPPLPNNSRSKSRKSAKNRFPGRKARYEIRRINAEKRPRYKGRFVSKAELEALVAAGLCNEAGLSSNDDENNEQQQYNDKNEYDDDNDMARNDSTGLVDSDAVVPSSIKMILEFWSLPHPN